MDIRNAPSAPPAPLLWGKQIFCTKESSYDAPFKHFLVIGSTGSGKTLLIHRLMKGALGHAGWREGCRALVYDPKTDVLPILYGICRQRYADEGLELSGGALRERLDQDIKILNPLDARACAWAMHRDVVGPIGARQMATLLVPESEKSGNNEFFNQACREILTGIMLALTATVQPGEAWGLRDVLAGALDPAVRRQLLGVERTKDDKDLALLRRLKRAYIDVHPELESSIQATLSASLGIYEPIAALWHAAEKKGRTFSIEEWASSTGQILVLGNDESARASLDPINKALFKRITERVLAGRELQKEDVDSGRRRTWVFLDEIREAGELDGLRRLLNKGRTKGACVVVGLQDIEGLRDVYGAESANEIVGQCNNVALLRINNPETAEWAASTFGQSEQKLTDRSVAVGEKIQWGRNDSKEIRARVTSSQLLDIPTTGPQNGLSGLFKNPYVEPGFHVRTLQWTEVWDAQPTKSEYPEHRAFVENKVADEYMEGHTAGELLKRFGFAKAMPTFGEIAAKYISGGSRRA